MGIYVVRFGGLKSELEITEDVIACVAGDETQFSFPRRHFLWVDNPRPDRIKINYFEGGEELVEVEIESDHCISIMNELTAEAADAAAGAAAPAAVPTSDAAGAPDATGTGDGEETAAGAADATTGAADATAAAAGPAKKKRNWFGLRGR